MFISAETDNLVNPSHTKMLFDNYKGSKIIKKFKGDHNEKRPDAVLRQI